MNHSPQLPLVLLVASIFCFNLYAAEPKKGPVDPNAPPPPLPEQYLESPPPGWFPINKLEAAEPWSKVSDVADKAQLYFPRGDRPVRGVYVSVVFHTQDPRELARIWDFALVTIPWPMLYDLGLGDNRSPRGKQTGYPIGNMGFLLHYLERAAKETNHPELATAPIVGWLMQGGYEHAPDLFQRAPERLLAWSDSFAHIYKHENFLRQVPFVLAWEFGPQQLKTRRAERETLLPTVKDALTPAPNLACEASTYDMPHGVYSKWNLFAIYLDRCIKARLPAEPPPAGQPVKLKPVDREAGWCADFNEISNFVAIAPFGEARGMVRPVWLPDAYMAWTYRAYHSQDPLLTMLSPALEYNMSRHFPGGDRGPTGLGYGKLEGRAGEPVVLEAGPRTIVGKEKRSIGAWPYVKVEFHDGDQVLGVAEKAPWKIEGVKLSPGVHALFAVGQKADGSHDCSRPTLYGVR